MKNTKYSTVVRESDVRLFEKVVAFTKEFLAAVKPGEIVSPYSIIPIISQLVGLNNPLMGTGNSRYSLFSFISCLKGNTSLFQDLFGLPLAEKRLIIDEIYDMTAPYMLEENDNYIDLLLETKYRLSKNIGKKKYRKMLERKFELLDLLFRPYLGKGQLDFVHIAHYGNLEDVYTEQNFVKYFSKELSEEWFKRSYPIVNEFVIKNFSTSNQGEKKEIKGWLIFIANSTEQLLRDGNIRKAKILQGALLAKKMRTRIAGMGGLVASFAGGGHYLSEQVPEVGFTTGHAHTIANIVDLADRCIKRLNSSFDKNVIAIVGAAGSIGSGCAKLLAGRGAKEIILIDTASMISFSKLQKLEKELNEISNAKILRSENPKDMRKADIIIVATNSPFSIIDSEYIKPGTIVIDDSFPKNVSEELMKTRKDVLFLEGGAVQLPISIDIDVTRNMPDLMDAPMTRLISCKESYSCFSETLILAATNHKGNYGLGYSDVNLAKDIQSKAEQLGISSTFLQCYNKGVVDEKFDEVLNYRSKHERSE